MTTMYPPQNVPAHRRSRWSIRILLLLVINVPLGFALAILLPLDYRREMEDAINRKQAGIEEEAMTIYQGLSGLAPQGRGEVIQQYVDDVCAGMQDRQSPGHHIAVRWRGRWLQAEAHNRASREMLQAMIRAAESPSHRAALDGERTLVVGRFVGDDGDVYVSEYTTDIRRLIQRETWRILLPGGRLGIMHWNYDPSTPRGPSMDIRPRPERCRDWAIAVGFTLAAVDKIDLPPHHYGWVMSKP